jgi:hypothetical protein
MRAAQRWKSSLPEKKKNAIAEQRFWEESVQFDH